MCKVTAARPTPVANYRKHIQLARCEAMVSHRTIVEAIWFSSNHILDREVRDLLLWLARPVCAEQTSRNATVWINDAWAADEILVKRAGIYCSRPRMLIFAELGAGQWNMLNMYTITRQQRERFRDHRKLTHLGVGVQKVSRMLWPPPEENMILTVKKVKTYRSLQDDESKITTCDLLSSPNDFVAHFERYATSVVSAIGFGRRVADMNDPLITEVIDIMHRAAEMAVPAKDFPRLMESFPCESSQAILMTWH